MVNRKPGWLLNNKRQGFSLVEILIVLAIGTILAGLLLPAIQKARERGLVTKAQATIIAVETALSLYENDFGDYPTHSGTFREVLEILTEETGNPRWKGPYLRFKEKNIQDGELLDPWKEPYRYQYPQEVHLSTPFLLFSCGPDRKKGTADDTGNW
ncbi:MAG: type II secretion system protein GspG [Candidatus Omnitrophica bacterium]|nr:type II secretion system protein GspG [Candidatus Omnitrophota bacterium]